MMQSRTFTLKRLVNQNRNLEYAHCLANVFKHQKLKSAQTKPNWKDILWDIQSSIFKNRQFTNALYPWQDAPSPRAVCGRRPSSLEVFWCGWQDFEDWRKDLDYWSVSSSRSDAASGVDDGLLSGLEIDELVNKEWQKKNEHTLQNYTCKFRVIFSCTNDSVHNITICYFTINLLMKRQRNDCYTELVSNTSGQKIVDEKLSHRPNDDLCVYSIIHTSFLRHG